MPSKKPALPETAASSSVPTPPKTDAIEGSDRPRSSSYWKGRQFPPRQGSRAAQAQPRRSKSNAPADLRPDRLKISASPVVAKRADAVSNDKQLELVMQLQEFEHFRETILPTVQQDLSNGLTGEQIMKKYQAMAAARLVSLLPNLNPKFAAQAATQILDRTMGKAIERRQVAHAFADLTEKELDSLLIATLKEVEDDVD